MAWYNLSMTNLASYLLANTYAGFSPLVNTAAAVCSVNGQEVPCPSWLPALGGSFFLVMIALVVFFVVVMWRVYAKAGQPGWAAIVPIYNMVVLLQIVKKPVWWIVLMFIPFVNIIISLIVAHELSKVFGHGLGFTLGLIILPIIFYPILAFGRSTYQSSASIIS